MSRLAFLYSYWSAGDRGASDQGRWLRIGHKQSTFAGFKWNMGTTFIILYNFMLIMSLSVKMKQLSSAVFPFVIQQSNIYLRAFSSSPTLRKYTENWSKQLAWIWDESPVFLPSVSLCSSLHLRLAEVFFPHSAVLELFLATLLKSTHSYFPSNRCTHSSRLMMIICLHFQNKYSRLWSLNLFVVRLMTYQARVKTKLKWHIDLTGFKCSWYVVGW